MAKCEISYGDDFIESIKRLGGNVDKIVSDCLEAGAQAALPHYKASLQKSLSGSSLARESRSTGELLRSVGISSVKIDKEGFHNIVIGFHEPRKKQYAARGKRSYDKITNAMIANVLEHGKHRDNQRPRPWHSRAKKNGGEAAIEAMQKKFDEEIDKLL